MPFGKAIFLAKRKDHGPIGGTANSDPLDILGAVRLKVLVVDDEPLLADLTVELLAMHGIDGFAVYSGEDALHALLADPDINAIFSDVMMPGMTGLALAATVASRYPKVSIFLTSGYVFPSVKPDRLGYPFLPKPYRIDSLISLLRGGPLFH